jgi:phosphoglycolate phosphatase
MLGGDSLPTKKPDPAPLLYVCDKLGVMPDKAVMIGDSKNDILAGQNAGMDTLALSYGYNYGQDIRDFQPTQAFDNFATLTRYLLDKKEP